MTTHRANSIAFALFAAGMLILAFIELKNLEKGAHTHESDL